MNKQIGHKLSLAKALVLSLVGLSVLCIPLTIGMINAPPSQAKTSGDILIESIANDSKPVTYEIPFKPERNHGIHEVIKGEPDKEGSSIFTSDSPLPERQDLKVGDAAIPAVTAERFQKATKDSPSKVFALKENSHQPIVMAHAETQTTLNAEKKTGSHEPVREPVLTTKTEENVLLAEGETTMEESPDQIHSGDELKTEEVGSGQNQGIPPMEKANPIPKVTVNFENPEDYRDIEVSHRGPKQGQKVILPLIEKYLVKLGEKYLKEGQALDITFTNIDLAGEKEPWQTPPLDNVRFMKSVYPPELAFKYTFSDLNTNHTVVGEETLIDLSYGIRIRRDTLDRIFYEKQMLRDWIRKLTSDKE